MQTTVDENELNHFNNLSFVRRTRELTLLYKMNIIRIPFIQKCLANAGALSTNISESAKPLSGLRILDVGCGRGILSEPLVEAGAFVTGMDAAPNVIENAKLHAKRNQNINDNNLHYVCDTIENFCENKIEEYDVVVASEIIEHVTSPDLFLQSCIKTLKPGGSIFVTTINKTIWSWLRAIVLYEYIARIIPQGTHEWNKFISPAEVSDILNRYNCKVKLVDGWQYNMLTDTFQNTNDLSVFYLLHAVKDK